EEALKPGEHPTKPSTRTVLSWASIGTRPIKLPHPKVLFRNNRLVPQQHFNIRRDKDFFQCSFLIQGARSPYPSRSSSNHLSR
ncbi:unnamed protein product, partial [Brassica rapa subsp. trilocularis]